MKFNIILSPIFCWLVIIQVDNEVQVLIRQVKGDGEAPRCPSRPSRTVSGAVGYLGPGGTLGTPHTWLT